MPLRLEDDGMCFACGHKNPYGFKLKFDHAMPGVLKSEALFEKHHQGFKNIVHGGFLALLMDEIMVNLLWKENIPAVTGELNVRFKEPVTVGEKIQIESRLESGKGRLLHLTAKAVNSKGVLVATAKTTCVRIPQRLPGNNLPT